MKLVSRSDLFILPLVLLAWSARAIRLPAFTAFSVALLTGLASRFSRRKRRATEVALAAAFDESLPNEERERIIRGSFRGVWEEHFSLIAGPPRDVSDRWDIRGLDHLRAALAGGRGVILWESSGLGVRWRTKRVLVRQGFPMHQVHGPNHMGGFLTREEDASRLRNRFLRPLFDRSEMRFVESLSYLPSDGSLNFARDLAQRLKRNQIICITGDGNLGQRTLLLPFLGSEARFSTGMVSLARSTGAALLPMFSIRSADGRFKLIIEEPVPVAASPGAGDRALPSLLHYAELLEKYVRQYPAQYRNWYRSAR